MWLRAPRAAEPSGAAALTEGSLPTGAAASTDGESESNGLRGTLPALAGKEVAFIGNSLLVALDARDIDFAEVLAELDRREGVSGIDEKANRSA